MHADSSTKTFQMWKKPPDSFSDEQPNGEKKKDSNSVISVVHTEVS